jgi:hypothetical protein
MMPVDARSHIKLCFHLSFFNTVLAKCRRPDFVPVFVAVAV